MHVCDNTEASASTSVEKDALHLPFHTHPSLSFHLCCGLERTKKNRRRWLSFPTLSLASEQNPHASLEWRSVFSYLQHKMQHKWEKSLPLW